MSGVYLLECPPVLGMVPWLKPSETVKWCRRVGGRVGRATFAPAVLFQCAGGPR